MNRNNAGNPRNYDFSRVPRADVPRTRFYRPSSHMTTIGTDYLYPLYLDEVLPGDTFRLDVGTFARLTTALVPFMSNLYIDWQFFFVPSRLVWSNFQKFCGEQENPDDSIDYTMPYLTAPSGGVDFGTIYDYMGIPPKKEFAAHDVQSLPFRCYNLIYNEWYRDENLQNSVPVPKGDGPDSASDFTLLKRGKRKDYFTSCLPAPQKGPASTIPIIEQMTIPVRGTGMALGVYDGTFETGHVAGLYQSSGGVTQLQKNAYAKDAGYTISGDSKLGAGAVGVTLNPEKSGLEAVLDSPTVVTINALRQAFQLQKFAERMNRGGTRYIEILKSMFGVTSPDARLQRPELLTAFSVPVQISQVVQTSSSEEGSTPQGNLAANGTASNGRFAFNKSFVEHGYILGLCSVRSDLMYQQGLHRMWSRTTRYDVFWPPFAHLGEQAVKNKEIYLQDSSVVDSDGVSVNEKTFGFQERWSEYKYGEHRISGELRSDYTQSLDVWHLAQDFSSLPTLSPTFIESGTPIGRVVSVSPDVSRPFVVDCAFRAICTRPLPLYDIPGLVDHF